MRVLIGAASALVLLSANTAGAQDDMCSAITQIVGSSGAYFTSIRGEAIEDAAPLHRVTVPLPRAESCTVLSDENFGMYQCEFDVATESDNVAESLARQMHACLPTAQPLRRKTSGTGGWEFEIANLTISAARKDGSSDVLVGVLTR